MQVRKKNPWCIILHNTQEESNLELDAGCSSVIQIKAGSFYANK